MGACLKFLDYIKKRCYSNGKEAYEAVYDYIYPYSDCVSEERYYKATISSDWSIEISKISQYDLSCLNNLQFVKYGNKPIPVPSREGRAISNFSYVENYTRYAESRGVSRKLTQTLTGSKVANSIFSWSGQHTVTISSNTPEAVRSAYSKYGAYNKEGTLFTFNITSINNLLDSIKHKDPKLRIKLLPVLLQSHPEIVSLEIKDVFTENPYEDGIECLNSFIEDGNNLQWLTYEGKIISKDNYNKLLGTNCRDKADKEGFILKWLENLDLQKQCIRIFNAYESIVQPQCGNTDFTYAEKKRIRSEVEKLVTPAHSGPYSYILQAYIYQKQKHFPLSSLYSHRGDGSVEGFNDMYTIIDHIYASSAAMTIEYLDEILGAIVFDVNCAYDMPEDISGIVRPPILFSYKSKVKKNLIMNARKFTVK